MNGFAVKLNHDFEFALSIQFKCIFDLISKTKSFWNGEAMEMFSEYSIPNQLAGVPITNPAPPRELFEVHKLLCLF